MKFVFLLFVFIVVIIAGALLYGGVANSPQAPIGEHFEKKIVYTSDQGVDPEELRRDCSARGGKFDECGSPCAQGEVCIQVCAFTCVLP